MSNDHARTAGAALVRPRPVSDLGQLPMQASDEPIHLRRSRSPLRLGRSLPLGEPIQMLIPHPPRRQLAHQRAHSLPPASGPALGPSDRIPRVVGSGAHVEVGRPHAQRLVAAVQDLLRDRQRPASEDHDRPGGRRRWRPTPSDHRGVRPQLHAARPIGPLHWTRPMPAALSRSAAVEHPSRRLVVPQRLHDADVSIGGQRTSLSPAPLFTIHRLSTRATENRLCARDTHSRCPQGKPPLTCTIHTVPSQHARARVIKRGSPSSPNVLSLAGFDCTPNPPPT